MLAAMKTPIHAASAPPLAAIVIGALAFPPPIASAQTPRPFDGRSGVIVACAPSPSAPWTEPACTRIVELVRRRGAVAKMRVAQQPFYADMPRRRFGVVEGFEGDKAVRLIVVFAGGGSGRASLSLTGVAVVERGGERTTSEIFSSHTVVDGRLDPREIDAAARAMIERFFEIGEGRD
jgi:hypothetical protein